eukprot:TRINITY_DN20170_c0_g1_i1.p1 TRINITY_DN20170_c0_g1~~TRINITY_DN20170_c0_g1_i1.p1  ORF type:complete len:275 (-),score=25.28 TRINITY_DN20170_c0_g1_i1:32-856(-)
MMSVTSSPRSHICQIGFPNRPTDENLFDNLLKPRTPGANQIEYQPKATVPCRENPPNELFHHFVTTNTNLVKIQKQYSCNFCDKRFGSRRDLKIHKDSHKLDPRLQIYFQTSSKLKSSFSSDRRQFSHGVIQSEDSVCRQPALQQFHKGEPQQWTPIPNCASTFNPSPLKRQFSIDFTTQFESAVRNQRYNVSTQRFRQPSQEHQQWTLHHNPYLTGDYLNLTTVALCTNTTRETDSVYFCGSTSLPSFNEFVLGLDKISQARHEVPLSHDHIE